jgi:hypothetical protein
MEIERLNSTVKERRGIDGFLDRLRARKLPRPNLDFLDDADFARRFTPEVVGDDDAAIERASPAAKRKRGPQVFRERDLKRAITGHLKAGLSIKRTMIDTMGRIVIETGQPDATPVAPENEWDSL